MDRQLERKNYTIGWICALPLEFAAAIAMLDEQHLPLPQDKLDDNAYKFGRIGSYNIIVACLPSGVYGVTSAGNVATQMHRSFPDLEAALMVGIAGGAPDPPRCDIRLGDVVVSEPTAGFGGVLQYDFGKTEKEGRFVQTGVLNKPPKRFLTAIAKLKSDYLLQHSNQSGLSGGNSQNNNVSEIIANALKNGTVPQTFSRPPNTANDSDRLFRASYEHPFMNSSCDECNPSMIVGRESRPHDQPYIHYGLIASGNQVMKHGITRDRLAREKNVLCFEMEAAGIMDELPSLVIRGICDYSDSHKNKVWQPYAALSAAAFAKELLLQLPFRVNEMNEPERIVLNLPIAEGAAYGSYVDQHKPECLAGTRIDLLKTISNWIEDPHSQGKSIFWLVGKAGTGKSTISRTVAHNLHTSNRLAASFFFNREEEDRRTGTRFFTTIAAQLANHYSSLGSRIQRAIQLNPDISTKALNEQFDKLVLQPLSGTRLATHRAKLVLVVDALDECEEKENIRIIIYLLSQLKSINTMDVRVFLTSRPDLPILSTFKKLSDDTYEDVSLHEVPKIEHDISLFLRHKLCEIQERDELCLPEEWPGEGKLEKLVKRAMPLFIYAATLCRFIGDELWDPDEQIELVLNYQTNWETSQLQMTYLPVLNQLIVGQNPIQKKKLVDEFRQIVGTIINLASPMSASSLARLLSLPERVVNCRLRPLQSVLDIPNNPENPIRTFHLSFRDFLLDRSLQEKNPFWVDESESHRLIAIGCINLMSSSTGLGLRRNICNLPSLGSLRVDIRGDVIEKHMAPELRYACRYWVSHLVKSGHRLIDNDQTHKFLVKHLLHWLEATSLLDIKFEVSRAVDDLKSIIDITNGAEIYALVNDMKRFLLQNQDIIHKAPLQVYISALIFAPKTSIIRKIFDPKTMVHCLAQLPRVRDKWSALLQTLEGHKSLVKCVAFSPNGKLLASGSYDGLLNLWDITGALLQTLHGHEDKVNGVAFSPNSKILASASDDMTSKLWDISTGTQLQKLGHGDRVIDVAFSPSNGEILASTSNDETIRLWNTTTGTVLQILEWRKPASIRRVAFSPNNGEILASASYDGEIKLWNTITGALLQTFKGHEYPVHSLTFSSDNGEVLASASRERTIKFWDINTGTLSRTLKGCEYNDTCVTLSSNARIIACGSINRTIKLWDIITETPLQTLKGHTASVNSISFSPDNKLLASVSSDCSVKLWDVADCENRAVELLLKTPEKHSLNVNSVAFSPDGKVLTSSSSDGTIKLWSATGVLLRILEEHKDFVSNVEFSPDGRIFASASRDNTIKLWDTTGTLLQTLTEDDWVMAIKFSPDGQKLASITSYQFLIKLWDTSSTVKFLWTSNIHETWIRDYTFSPDGKILASAADDETIGLWDTNTGKVLRTIHVPGSNDLIFRGIEFSPDSKVIASKLGRGARATVQLWDTATGVLLQTLGIGTSKDWVHDLAFSPNREGDRYIDTDIKSLYRTVFSLGGVGNPNNPEFQPSVSVTSRGEWLARNGEKLIWLPHDYRPQCSAVHGSTIVLGHHSGGVSFFTFRT
ncbi:hypothetical protein TWF102_006527 [Orbilia oligospora]|uniref:Mitochondrial division protein 1 n=1 Tax=Orbilia oligospora TaxID=2813651 RepID=A0A7C8NQC0_ORBOL|nr:hypothetical protein TWF706_007605 [Orbilia oligospora]KAF3096679.1 hypothetical protein TWF102_006527 [Orbilia oligospora]KAF3118247.1 hypothetical protein TWF103_000262 [Orbilia oligospora]KAF3122115.1 hypothetical protein TWF703_001497 [Orbilia oligospora]